MALDRGECRLQQYRLKAGLTQVQLSDQLLKRFGLNVSDTLIGHLENNRRAMSIEILRAMSLIFKVPMDNFYTWPIK